MGAATGEKPRILQVNKYHYPRGGSERVYFDLSGLLAEAGHGVMHFSMAHPENLPSPCAGHFVCNVEYGRGGPLRKLRDAARVVYSAEARDKLDALLDAHPVDLAHLHNYHHQLTPSILPVLKRRGVPVVHYVHDLKVVCANYRMLTHDGVCERCKGGRYYQGFLHRCTKGSAVASFVNMVEMYAHATLGYPGLVDRYVTPSAFYRDKLVEFGFDPERVRHVPYAVDVDSFQPADTPGEFLLYLGRLSQEKGLYTLLAAAAKRPDIPLKLAGTGPMRGELEAECKRLGLHHVAFLGHQPPEAVRELLRECRAVVLPSEWYEAFGLCLVEAAATGRPAIGARIGGIPEVVRDGETGQLVPPGDADALAEAMARLWGDPARARDLGQAARARAEREYHPRVFLERILALYGELLAAP